jgi:hypothetical protein
MKPRNGALVALLFLATCNEEAQNNNATYMESAQAALGVVATSEVAVWHKVGSSSNPDGRYLQAIAFDESRKVFVLFGGTNTNPSTGSVTPNQETWEWSQVTGKWTNRTGVGTAPDARSGAAMVFDSVRGKVVLFGGRAGSGYNYEDTWEWDPATGAWTDVSAAGSHPSARSQHGMVYEKSTGKVLLFGGGRSDSASYDGTGVTVSMGDTWEYDPTTHVWTARTVTTTPSARHDLGLVWDSSRNKAVLFAGMQSDIAGAAGVPKQDTWEWDPAASTWIERTVSGSKPSQRYAHAMAFDGNRKKVLVFGGWDIGSGGSKNDLWEWEPTTGAWTQRLTGSESGVPSPRMYASLVADDADARMELVAGISAYGSYGSPDAGIIIMPPVMSSGTGSRDVWELDPATAAFTNRTAALDVPSPRQNQAMAYNPSTGKTYLYGGSDSMTGQYLDDLWEWDGKVWAQVAADVRPLARSMAAMAYDPARKSLILFGGNGSNGNVNETWEWMSSTRKWAQLKPASSPDPLYYSGMVTDTTRNKILLFGGIADGATLGPGIDIYKNPMRNDVWEWDGAAMTWTNRTLSASLNGPTGRTTPIMAYDEGRQKLFLYDGANLGASPSAFWEWDPLSAGWNMIDTNDTLDYGYQDAVAYDSIRRRVILLMDAYSPATGYQETWELDAKGPTWYVRSLPGSPGSKYAATMVFDSARGVAVLFGGQSINTSTISSETWEYKVTSLGNGEGCTVSSATSCASGNCVDGVCCDVAACTGACKSCNVAGYQGTCVLAKAGTEVVGSCSSGQACDGSGICKTKNGQVCTTASACASGNCVDGVCCDSACTGTCSSCSLEGRAGKCSPYPAGTDPQGECGVGTGVCKSTCDGVGACAYPQGVVTCGNCYTCDGMGTCSNYDFYCGILGTGGTYYPDGGFGGAGGFSIDGGLGGTGGYPTSKGGAGGSILNTGGAGGSGGRSGSDGGGTVPNLGGSDGGIILDSGGRGGSGGLPSSGGIEGGLDGGNSLDSGGSGGSGASSGGSGGSITILGSGGSSAKRDGGIGDASSVASFNKSGCSCVVGQAQASDAGLSTPFLLAGVALLLVRKRRRRG